MQTIHRIALLAGLAFTGCLVPACIYNQPPAQTAADVSDGGERMGSYVNLKDADGTRRKLAAREDGDEYIPMHDIGVITAGDNNIGNVDVESISAGDNNIGNVDVASSALPTGASTSAHQVTLHGYVDSLEGYLDGVETTLTAVQGYVDGLETLLGGTITVSGTVATSALPVNPYTTATPLNGVAADASTTSTAIDVRGYRDVWIEISSPDVGTAGTATVFAYGSFLSTFGATTAVEYTLSDLLSQGGCALSGGDGDDNIDVSYSGEASPVYCAVHINGPMPYLYIGYTTLTGGVGNTLTAKIAARAY